MREDSTDTAVRHPASEICPLTLHPIAIASVGEMGWLTSAEICGYLSLPVAFRSGSPYDREGLGSSQLITICTSTSPLAFNWKLVHPFLHAFVIWYPLLSSFFSSSAMSLIYTYRLSTFGE